MPAPRLKAASCNRAPSINDMSVGVSRPAEANPRQAEWGVAWVAIIVLAGIVPLMFASTVLESAGGFAGIPWFRLLAIVYAGVHLGLLFGRGDPRYMQILFWTFGYVWLGLAGFAQDAAHLSPLGDRFGKDATMVSALVVLAGMAAYDGGRLLHARRGRISQRSEGSAVAEAASRRGLSERRVLLFGILVVVSTPLWVRALGGWRLLFTSREAAQAALVGPVRRGLSLQSDQFVSTLIKNSSTVAAFLALYALLIVLARQRQAGKPITIGQFYLVVALLIVNAVLNNPFSNPRFWVGTVVLGVLLSTRSARRKVGVRAAIAGILVGATVLFPYAGYFRYTDRVVAVKGPLETLQIKGDYDAAPAITAAVAYTQDRGYTYGRQMTGAALFFVPRRVWAGKPSDTGAMLGLTYGTPTANISSPLWAESYIDGGWWLLLAVFLAMGYGSERLDLRFIRSLDPTSLIRVVVPVIAAYQVIILRGSLLQAMSRLAVLVLLLWILAPRHEGDVPPAPLPHQA